MAFNGSLAFSSIAEKDIDLLLLEEFSCSTEWIQWFYAMLRTERTDLPPLFEIKVEAAHSVNGVGDDGRPGESDLLVTISGNNGHSQTKIAVLIEDKISAPFTPGQPDRYAGRALRELRERKCEFAACVLISPSRYSANQKPEGFDLRISLEDIRQHFHDRLSSTTGELARRFQHRIHLLDRVCNDLHRYGVAGVIPHEENTRLITSIDAYVQRQAPSLIVKPRVVRGSGSAGPGFDLPSKSMLRRAVGGSGTPLGAGTFEINFNWHLASGFERIRFHHWVSWVPILSEWWRARLAPEVTPSVTSNGKSFDLEVKHLPPITEAISISDAPSAVVDGWIAKAIAFQSWFESHSAELGERLRSGLH